MRATQLGPAVRRAIVLLLLALLAPSAHAAAACQGFGVASACASADASATGATVIASPSASIPNGFASFSILLDAGPTGVRVCHSGFASSAGALNVNDAPACASRPTP